jgi:hypothetical protein
MAVRLSRRSPSSRGPGRGPFKAKTRVRIPLGTNPLYLKLCGEKSVISAWRGRGGIWTVLVPAVLYLALEEQDS